MGFRFVAGYLDADSIIASSHHGDPEGVLLLDRHPLRVVGTVKMENSANGWASLAWIGDSRWITVGNVAAELWQLDVVPTEPL